ncbi:hypothetical protein D5086_008195 [Populus alba]|uniref:Uncharacterized protein n=1 Tax=Populus alba TaxID=43335 RepID=A0ACC4CEQ7_POPAL
MKLTYNLAYHQQSAPRTSASGDPHDVTDYFPQESSSTIKSTPCHVIQPFKPLINLDHHLRVEEEEDVGSSSDQSLSESESEFETRRRVTSLPRPASLNAFDIISFSPGFDLSGLFEEGGEGARFVSGAPVSKIISKLEEIAKVVSFTVRKKDCRVSLEGSREGVRGPLTIAAEIFELTPKLVVVEVKKKGGDRGEYEEFCNKELKPGLQKLMQEESEAAANVTTTAPVPSGSPQFTIDPFPTDSLQLPRKREKGKGGDLCVLLTYVVNVNEVALVCSFLPIVVRSVANTSPILGRDMPSAPGYTAFAWIIYSMQFISATMEFHFAPTILHTDYATMSVGGTSHGSEQCMHLLLVLDKTYCV